MQGLEIIHEFTTLLHQHGPESKEVESFLKQYDHIPSFTTRARTLQSVFIEKDRVTKAYLHL